MSTWDENQWAYFAGGRIADVAVTAPFMAGGIMAETANLEVEALFLARNATVEASVTLTSIESEATLFVVEEETVEITKILSNEELVSQAAIRAENAVGGTGRFAGTEKHTYARIFLKKYQNLYGYRGLELNEYFKGDYGRGFLDVHDLTNALIYDFKFGKPYMKTSQFSKYTNHFGESVYIVDRFGNIIRR